VLDGEQLLPSKPRLAKDIYTVCSDFETLTNEFVFYVPTAMWLVQPRLKDTFTDNITNTLMQVCGEHPLVIQETPQKVFKFAVSDFLQDDLKAGEHMIFAVAKKVWDRMSLHIRCTQVFDETKGLFAMVTPHEEKIGCPLRRFTGKPMSVQYFDIYSNSRTYRFSKQHCLYGTEAPVPTLLEQPPLRDIVDIGERLFAELRKQRGVSDTLAQLTQETVDVEKDIADKTRAALAKMRPPVDVEMLGLSAAEREAINEMIAFHKNMWGTSDVDG
jgi:hypothetical protein